MTKEVGGRVTVCGQYMYCHSYCGVRGYSDRGGRREGDSMWTVHVLYIHVHGWSDKGSMREGVRVLPQLLWHMWIEITVCVCQSDCELLSSTMTQHGSTGHDCLTGEWGQEYHMWSS